MEKLELWLFRVISAMKAKKCRPKDKGRHFYYRHTHSEKEGSIVSAVISLHKVTYADIGGDFVNRVGILKSLEFSSSAYRDIQPYSANTCTAKIDNYKSGVQCFLRRRQDTLWITFRGSDSSKDWMTNLTFWKKTIPYDNTESDIRVHSGFINAYKTPGVRDKILEAITRDTHYIKISGHSQGAALSVLCAVDIQYNYPDRNIEVVLFGCPRVGNKAFQQSYNKRVDKTVRVENGNDIVTKVPFAFMGYRHVGAKIHIGAQRLPWRLSANDHYPHKYYSSFLGKFMP